MRLPKDMHSSGLFIAGCSCSNRRDFTAHYVKQLLADHKRVIFITDKLSTDFEQTHFCNQVGINQETKEGISFNKMTRTFDAAPFEEGAKIAVFSGGYDFETYCEFNPDLLSFLGSIKKAKVGGEFNAPFVVVIEDDMGYSGAVEDLIPSALDGIIGYDDCVGFVVSTISPLRYRGAQNRFKHFVFFKMCDSTEFDDLKVIKRSKLVKGGDGYIQRESVISVDIKSLQEEHFNYTCSHIAEWALNVKFCPNL